MTEADYWFPLEGRICAEFAGLAERRLRHFWCDGFEPRCDFLGEPEPRIEGCAWIYDGAFEAYATKTVRARHDPGQ